MSSSEVVRKVNEEDAVSGMDSLSKVSSETSGIADGVRSTSNFKQSSTSKKCNAQVQSQSAYFLQYFIKIYRSGVMRFPVIIREGANSEESAMMKGVSIQNRMIIYNHTERWLQADG